MFKIIRACLGGKMKFFTRKWDGYEISLFHNQDNIRSYPFFSWTPYFWDNEIIFDLGIKTPKFGKILDDWTYHWELRDLDGQIITKGDVPTKGDGIVAVTNKGFRRKFQYWNSGKHRAVVLGNLHPHREYIVYMKFITSESESREMQMACLSVTDRSTWQMQILMEMFLIFFAVFVAVSMRGCGVEV